MGSSLVRLSVIAVPGCHPSLPLEDLVQLRQVQLVSLDKPLSFRGVVFPARSLKPWLLQVPHLVSRPPACSGHELRGGA